MKTIWNFIKSETNSLKGHTVTNYQNSPDTFIDLLLSVAEKIMQTVRHSDTEDTSRNKNPVYNLSYSFKIFCCKTTI
jgi:hypothetical protein